MTSRQADAVRRRRGLRLTGARRRALLTGHIAASVALLGTSAGLAVAGVHAATRGDASEAHAIYGLTHRLVFTLDVPFAFIALASGIWLALASKWRLFRYWWVTAKLALLLTTIGVGAGVIGPRITRLVLATGQGNSGGSGRWLFVAACAGQFSMLLAATILGVFKPFGRISPPSPERPTFDERGGAAYFGA